MIKLKSLNGGTRAQRAEVEDGLTAANRIWSSDGLLARMKAHKRLDGSLGFENTEDTAEEIWARMQAGDILIDVTIYDPDYWERMRDRVGRGVVGFEDEDGVHVNSYILDGEGQEDVAGNLSHETLHELDYRHDFEVTARRPYSAPYAIGEMVRLMLAPVQQEVQAPAYVPWWARLWRSVWA